MEPWPAPCRILPKLKSSASGHAHHRKSLQCSPGLFTKVVFTKAVRHAVSLTRILCPAAEPGCTPGVSCEVLYWFRSSSWRSSCTERGPRCEARSHQIASGSQQCDWSQQLRSARSAAPELSDRAATASGCAVATDWQGLQWRHGQRWCSHCRVPGGAASRDAIRGPPERSERICCRPICSLADCAVPPHRLSGN